MRFSRIFLIFGLVGLLMLCACGSGAPTAKSVRLTVTAAQSSIGINQTAALTANFDVSKADGYLPSGAVWYITETHNATGDDCSFDIGHEGDATPGQCASGVVTYDKAGEKAGNTMAENATYFAPSTPGTYHITYGIEFQDYYDSSSRQYVSAETAIQVTSPSGS